MADSTAMMSVIMLTSRSAATRGRMFLPVVVEAAPIVEAVVEAPVEPAVEAAPVVEAPVVEVVAPAPVTSTKKKKSV